jgi:hypothetical protein
VQGHKVGVQVGCSQLVPTGLAASHGSSLVPEICDAGLEPLLPEDLPAGSFRWGILAQFLVLPLLEVHAALCQSGLLEHKHGLSAVLGS